MAESTILPAPVNPKSIGTILLEELKRTMTVGDDGVENAKAETEFEKKYLEWVFTALPADDFLLQPDHLLDGEAFVRALASQPGTACSTAIFKQLPESLQERMRSRAPDPCVLDDLLGEVNKLLKTKESILPTEVLEKGDEQHQAILKEFGAKLPPAATNRLLLEAAFPELIAKVWESLKVLYKWIHAHPEQEHNALCLSGGGIRSATFALGILQGLAGHGILSRFQYLSTVSGGGYIGSWLSAWIFRQDFKKVSEALASGLKPADDQGPNPPEGGKDPLRPEPDEVRHLREYSNYLTPKLGITSADTWTLAATYLRNLFLNWCVFLPALALLLMVPRCCVASSRQTVPDALGFTVFALGGVGILWALVYGALHRPSMGGKNPGRAGQREFLIFCFGPLYFSAVCLTAVWAWLQQPEQHFGDLVFNDLPNTNVPLPKLPFMVFAVGLHALACLIYGVKLGWKGWKELVACVLSGALGGLLLWAGGLLARKSLMLAPATELFVCFGAPWFLGSFLFSLFLFVGLTSHSTSDEDREWWARMAAWSLIAMGAWCLFSVLVLFGPEWLMKLPRLLAALGGVTGLITLILSHSGTTPANRKEATSAANKPAPANVALVLAAPLFIACFVAALSLGTTLLIGRLDPDQLLRNGTLLSVNDVTDFPALATKLKTQDDPVSAKLWEEFSPALKQQITDYVATDSRGKEALASLVRTLNGLIQSESLFEPGLFPATGLREKELEKLGKTLLGQNRSQLNRLLLQTSFPTELDQNRFDHRMITHQSSYRSIIWVSAGLLAVAVLLSLWININRFSLHAIYRNRLIRAYLGASNRRRQPNAFTGFDPGDNLCMADLKSKPFHVVNMALNLVSGEKLAWQQRKAQSFTASPLHAGSYRLGYRQVMDYASGRRKLAPPKKGQERDRGLRLGSAITISGAAASPNMGYHSSPVLAFVMTLFNVRLGAWLGNPGRRGEKSYLNRAPKLAFWHLIREALGMTDDKDRYVYLSDGGHFENLGLYEMVLRRCRTIVVSDAGCDPNCALEDLGNAIRKIRIDLGVPIELDQFAIASRKSTVSKYCAIGTIDYAAVDGVGSDGKSAPPGKLIYIKPAIAGDEPKDVFNYKEQSSLFPHEPTSDQWFSESQFESYRALSAHMIDKMCRGADGSWKPPQNADALAYFCDQAAAYLKGKPALEP